MMILGVRLPWSSCRETYVFVVARDHHRLSLRKNGSSLGAKAPGSRAGFPCSSTVSTLLAITASAMLGLAALAMLLSDPDHPGPSIQLRRGNLGAVHPLLSLRDVGTREGNFSSSDSSSSSSSIWESPSANLYYGCSEPGNSFQGIGPPTLPSGYLMIDASGGLNQQRTGITDAVVVARLLNATLVVPSLDHKSYWKDTSNFSDIFDVEWFIESLASDVSIVKEIPEMIRLKYVAKHRRITSLRVQRKCSPQNYEDKILPLLLKRKVVKLTKFDYRLANNLEPELQKLRCRVNYKALQFTPAIQGMGQELVRRMRKMSSRYIALHLRYEPDMLAFSGCYYGGGEKEASELGAIRKRWKSLHLHNPEKERRNGKCPLTPEEVGLMLRALGFGNDSYLYVASGEVYGGNESLAPLKSLFPNFFTKESLASKQELEPFSSFSSRMAALDYIVSDQSDVFVTNNNGNMARMLAGRRRYFGHKITIRPNTKKLGSLFLNREEMSWESFSSRVRKFQEGFMGDPNEVKPGRGGFHENPVACICDRRRPEQEQQPQQHLYESFSEEDEGEQLKQMQPEAGEELQFFSD